MRIASIALRKLKMRLKSPFETSFGATHDRTVVLVEVLADGLTGWSEVAASEGPFYNSETGDTAWLIIRSKWAASAATPALAKSRLCASHATYPHGVAACSSAVSAAPHNIAFSSLPGYTRPGDVSASKRYWEEDVIDPPVEVSPRGTIQVPSSPGLGYHVRRELIERWTTEEETRRVR